MNAAIEIKKGQVVNVPAEFQAEEGCVAFQRVEVKYFFYGAQQSDVLDTKILANGDQIVITGNGFIKDGQKLN